jgi:hypothetical protein
MFYDQSLEYDTYWFQCSLMNMLHGRITDCGLHEAIVRGRVSKFCTTRLALYVVEAFSSDVVLDVLHANVCLIVNWPERGLSDWHVIAIWFDGVTYRESTIALRLDTTQGMQHTAAIYTWMMECHYSGTCSSWMKLKMVALVFRCFVRGYRTTMRLSCHSPLPAVVDRCAQLSKEYVQVGELE